jgi:hypothetical protein
MLRCSAPRDVPAIVCCTQADAARPVWPRDRSETSGAPSGLLLTMAKRLQRFLTIAGMILAMGSLAAERLRVVIGEVPSPARGALPLRD